ncbi:SDR family NAD(P)-dependent oxidoreductase [Candidatus Uhrbacteria bacterium]|nr:SDR family NAD(P)-dependent oxidoreductase [Candidatus Uhrbacteria bacterium]
MPHDTALILGASKGLGQDIAAECHRRAWRTIEVASSLATASTDDRVTMRCDLRHQSDVEALIGKLRGGTPIDHFFWVAGTWWEGEFAEMPPEEMLRLIDVNFRNAMLVAHWAWERFAISSSAPLTYTVIGSTSGVRPRKHQEVYAATKHAQVGFARSLGESNRGSKNVMVSLFVLGGMRTHLFDAKPPANLAEFMDPAKVAAHIISRVSEQRDPYLEQEISRDSALGQSLI